MASPFYPRIIPELSEHQFEYVIQAIKDFQLTHGSLLKLVASEEPSTVLSRPVGVSVFPNQFPQSCFKEALGLQSVYNELYINVAEDEEWLEHALEDLIRNDDFTRTLWDVYKAVQHDGLVQPLTLGIFRSDYMVHVQGVGRNGRKPSPRIKQVEFNSYTVAGGIHGNIVTDMHQYLQRTAVYGPQWTANVADSAQYSSPAKNDTLNSIVDSLALAHRAYGPAINTTAARTAILMLVQPYNFNICDERPIEYGLWERDIPCFRAVFGGETIFSTTLGPQRELLFTPPTSASGAAFEISVAYMRAGYEPREYDVSAGSACRLRIEQSRAIKCPSLLSHLTTFKKVQQELAVPGVLERFLSPEKAEAVRGTFMPIYPLDGRSAAGREGRRIARDPEKAKGHVLKPSLEGGGHNVYGADIPEALKALPEARWQNYVLMELIDTPPQEGVLMSPRRGFRGPVVSELGVFGVCLWRKGGLESVGVEILENKQSGWSFKTKPADVDEMSVVKGYGCFDSPCLVDL